jgi:hypothetical protein
MDPLQLGRSTLCCWLPQPLFSRGSTYLLKVAVHCWLVQGSHVNAVERRLLPEEGLADELIVQQCVAEGCNMHTPQVLHAGDNTARGRQHTV